MSGYGIVGAGGSANAKLRELGWQQLANDFLLLEPGDLKGMLQALAVLREVALPAGCRLFAINDSVDLSALFADASAQAPAAPVAPSADATAAGTSSSGYPLLDRLRAQAMESPMSSPDPLSALLAHESFTEGEAEEGDFPSAADGADSGNLESLEEEAQDEEEEYDLQMLRMFGLR
ncbi:MAG: hypothetical protein ACOX1O_01005 [Eggerthellaceae bacterium]|jgi:hypothetical protein